MKKIKVDKNIYSENARWTFGKNIAFKFDSHIEKSIPMYKETQWLCNEISDFCWKPDFSLCSCEDEIWRRDFIGRTICQPIGCLNGLYLICLDSGDPWCTISIAYLRPTITSHESLGVEDLLTPVGAVGAVEQRRVRRRSSRCVRKRALTRRRRRPGAACGGGPGKDCWRCCCCCSWCCWARHCRCSATARQWCDSATPG